MKNFVKGIVATVFIIFVIGVVFGAINGEDETKYSTGQVNEVLQETQAEPDLSNIAVQPPEPPQPVREPGYYYDGMYKVGADIPAGEYLIYSERDFPGYYQVSKDSTGDMGSLIANDNFSNTRYITVKDGEYLTLTRARAKAADEAPAQTDLKDGMYKVGKDIEPGEYKVQADDSGMGYAEVSRNSRGGMNSIVQNHNFDGQKYITVRKGHYLKLARAFILQ